MAHVYIPAKEYSDRVPGKNIRALGGQPLLWWTIDAALAVRRADCVTVLTDSVDLDRMVRARYGGWVRVVDRPPELSEPGVTATDVTCWAVERDDLPLDDSVAVVQLLPTSPFRSYEHITAALELWDRDPAAAVVSVREIHNAAIRYERANGWLATLTVPAHWSPDNGWNVETAQTFVSTGGIQIASSGTLRRCGRFHMPKTRGLVLDSVAGLDIDTEADWKLAEGVAG